MWKLFKTAMFLALVLGIGYTYFLHRDQNMLQEQVIRLHVVADTDDPVDQEIKLRVRDEVLALVDTIKEGAVSKEEALQRLKDQLPQLQDAANRVLQEEGRFCQAVVTLAEEEFPTRFYDTFSLPAGIYDSLRVTIGSVVCGISGSVCTGCIKGCGSRGGICGLFRYLEQNPDP